MYPRFCNWIWVKGSHHPSSVEFLEVFRQQPVAKTATVQLKHRGLEKSQWFSVRPEVGQGSSSLSSRVLEPW